MSLFALPQKYYLYADETGAVGKYVDGEWIEPSAGTPSGWKEFDFIGTIQPLSSADINSLPEGERTEGMVKVYSDTDFNIGMEGSEETEAITLIGFDGNYYKLFKKDTWINDLIEHKKYIASLYKETVVVA